MLYKVNALKKVETAQGKYPGWNPDLVTVPYDFIKTRSTTKVFGNMFRLFSGQLFHKTTLSDYM